MNVVLFLPDRRVHLCTSPDDCECAQAGAIRIDPSFASQEDAASYLRRLAPDEATLRRLRRLVDDDSFTPAAVRLDDDEVIAALAHWLSVGRLRAVECLVPRQFTIVAREAALEPETPIVVGRQREDEELTWIEIKLVDEDGNPVPNERYEVTLPDGRIRKGALDKDGGAYIDQIPAGQCKVCFPDIDGREWRGA